MWLVGHVATAQESGFQAQNGWGLPRSIGEADLTQGLALDLENNRVIIPTTTGLQSLDLSSSAKQSVLKQVGVRDLQGVGQGDSLALAWFSRDIMNPNSVWWQYRGQARKVIETESSDFIVLQRPSTPLIIFVVLETEWSVVYAQTWNQARVEVYRTKLNVGALAARLNSSGVLGLVFAEGFRSTQTEKYDAKFVTFDLETKQKQTTLLGPAVYTGREQRYGLSVIGSSFYPIWWYETPEQQRAAMRSRRHFPRLALNKGGQLQVFDEPGQMIGQLENALYYRIRNRVYRLDISAPTLEPRLELLAPEAFTNAAMEQHDNHKLIVWQSLNKDGFSSTLWLADTQTPYQPTLLDRISVVLGWNPWYPWQILFGQSAFAALIAVFSSVVIAPLLWLISARVPGKHGLLIGFIGAWVAVLAARTLGELMRASSDWAFKPLMTPEWWLVVLGLILGSGLAWLLRSRYQKTDLAAVIGSGLITMTATFITMFSKIGFLQF
jgi:hypothetical protein